MSGPAESATPSSMPSEAPWRWTSSSYALLDMFPVASRAMLATSPPLTPIHQTGPPIATTALAGGDATTAAGAIETGGADGGRGVGALAARGGGSTAGCASTGGDGGASAISAATIGLI